MNTNMVYALIGMMQQIKPQNVAEWAPSTMSRCYFLVQQVAQMIEQEQQRRWEVEQARIKRHAKALDEDMDVGAHDRINRRKENGTWIDAGRTPSHG